MTAPTLKAFPVQDRLMEMILSGDYRYIGFGGGIRGTKTWGSLMAFIVLARLYPGSRWAVIRKDLERIRKTTIPSFNKLRRECSNFVGPVNGQTFEAPCKNGSVILFRGENIDRDPELDSFDGYEVNGFLLEEGDECHEATFYKCIERAGAWVLPEGEQPFPLLLSTFNPNAAWPKRLFYDPWSQGTLAPPWGFVPATIDDNQAMTEAYRESLKNLPPEEYEIRVGGDWSKISGRYYRSLNRAVHLIDRSTLPAKLPAWWEYWGGFDWGYEHWSVFCAMAKTTEGTVYCLDSVWVRREQDEDIAKTLLGSVKDGQFPEACLHEVYAGHDCWTEAHHGRVMAGVTTADVFDEHNIVLFQADIDRVNGGRALRRLLEIRAVPDKDGNPVKDANGQTKLTTGLYLVDTPGNRRIFEQLASIVPDENNINKPGKQNATDAGVGGDDGADCLRYSVATQIALPETPYEETETAKVRARLDPTSRREAESFDKLAAKAAKHVPAKYRG